jgi:putative DNA primase/helicase
MSTVKAGVALHLIPEELRVRHQWVNWMAVERHGKVTKVPVNPRTGELASVTDPATWGSLNEAFEYFTSNDRCHGIGYVFTSDDPYVGIDLDKCRDPESGEIEPWALEIIERLRSYTELSPSGTGVHIIVKGTLPLKGRRSGRIEMYVHSRYFTVTGNHLDGTPLNIEERDEALRLLHGEIFQDEPKQNGNFTNHRPFDDEALIDRASQATNGHKFQRLWRGDWHDYPSHSEADAALCSLLSFWTDGNATRIDGLFRRSDLFRPKWDERHASDGRTYGELTIERAQNLLGQPARKISSDSNGVGQNHGTPKADNKKANDKPVVKDVAEAVSRTDSFAQGPGGALWYYDGGYYRPEGVEYVCRRTKEILIGWNQERRWSSHFGREVAEYIRLTSRSLWGAPPLDLVNLTNGIFDLKTNTLMPHSSDHLSPIQLPFPYNEQAECSAWDAFTADVFPEDCCTLAYEIAAYLMRPDMSQQVAFLLYGTGSNGKSRYLRGLMHFLGMQNIAALSLQRLENDRFATARLVAKLANICPDLPSQQLASTSSFKSIVGGDVVLAECKFQDSFEFVPYARLVFSANQYPRSSDASYAFFRRFVVIPFERTFEQDAIDPRLLDARLSQPQELSGLFNRALSVLEAFQGRGAFVSSESTKAASTEFQQETDPVAVWLDAETQTGPNEVVSKQSLYVKYSGQMRERDECPITQKAFSQAVKRLRPQVREGQPFIGGTRQHAWLGMGLKIVRAQGAHDAQGHSQISISTSTEEREREELQKIEDPVHPVHQGQLELDSGYEEVQIDDES